MATLSGFGNPEDRMSVGATLKRHSYSYMRSIVK
jgi:hypothetical protein